MACARLSADALIEQFEREKSRALGNAGRREAGLYYTPRSIADAVVEIALRHSRVRPKSVLDPCAGAGAFLLAAARADLGGLTGTDLDPQALRVATRALKLCGARATMTVADALRWTPPAAPDLILSNPPYGHVGGSAERAELLRQFPALGGGEIDRYAAFLLRALELVRPGGAVALLIPDTWMFLARAGALRQAVLAQAEVAAIVDLGKPFASAKDTRVHAVVLERKPAPPRLAYVGRGSVALARVSREELLSRARAGWVVYRSEEERALCAAMDAVSVPLGAAADVGYGMRTGANARHVGRRPPARGEAGLLGGEDIVPYGVRWRPKTLLHPQPLSRLVERQQGTRRIAVQRIRTNAQAPWARWLEAAPVPDGLVCLDSLSTIACPGEDRLWALLALVQSVPLQRCHRLRTTDVNVKPGALRELPVPRALLDDPGELASLARLRAGERMDPAEAHAVDRRIDACVYRLFALPAELVAECEQGFWAERFSKEFQLLEAVVSDPLAKVVRQEAIP